MKNKTILFTNIIIISFLLIFSIVAIPIKTTIPSSAIANVIYKGNTNKNNVCFMINVYWGTEYIEDMLDILDTFNVKTTFFVGGSWVAKNVEMLKEINSRGHEIANHGYHHKDQDKLNEKQNIDEIMMTHKLVKANINIDMTLFAPPSGALDKELAKIATSLDYKTIMWTRDTIDWRDKDANIIHNRAIKNMSNGDLILMHPTLCTLNALSNILSDTLNNGFQPTTVTNTIS